MTNYANYATNYFNITESDGITDISQLYVPALRENVPWGINSTYIYKETTLASQFNSNVNKHLVIENKTLTGNIILKTQASGRTIIQDKLDVKELRFNNPLTNIATTDFSPFMYNIGSTIVINGGLTVSGGNFNLFKGVAGETSELNEPIINNSTINSGLFISGEIIGALIRNSTISGGSINGASIINNSITTNKILDSNITESKLATNSVTNFKIADQAITNSKIADGTIDNSKYGFKSITDIKIADGTISNAKYGSESITNNKIASATIRGANIALATITGENIAPASITGANIDIATITGANIAVATITGTNIANNSINSAHIIDGSILGTDICNLTITESKLASNSVSNTKILDNAITNTKIQDNAITNAKIQDNTLSGSKITDGTINNSKYGLQSITNDKIFLGTITGTSIAINSINSAHIIDGSILGTDICNLTITESKLASNSVSTVKIVDNAITNAKIQDNTLSGSKITDGTINNSKIQDNTINNSKIQDNTINNSKLLDNTINYNKILDNAIIESKILNNAVTTNKIADTNVTYAKLNSDVTSVLNAKAPIVSPTFTGNVTANNIKINGQNSLEFGADYSGKANQAGHIGYNITYNGIYGLDIHGASIYFGGKKLVKIQNHLYIDNEGGGINSVGSGMAVCSTQGSNGEYVTNMKPLGNTYIEMARYNFDFNFNILYNRGAIGFNYFNSDIRQKTNIAEPLINNACEYIKKIEFKSFNWKESFDINKSQCELGVIAQQLESVYPKFININYDEPKDETKHKSINTNVFSTFMMKGIQELILENIKLKKDIELIKQHLGL